MQSVESRGRSAASQLLLALPLVLVQSLLGAAAMVGVVLLFWALVKPGENAGLIAVLVLLPLLALAAFAAGLAWASRRRWRIAVTAQLVGTPLLAVALMWVIPSWL